MELYLLREEFLNCKIAEDFRALAGEKCSNKIILPFLFEPGLALMSG
jgi:hypothetical protein